MRVEGFTGGVKVPSPSSARVGLSLSVVDIRYCHYSLERPFVPALFVKICIRAGGIKGCPAVWDVSDWGEPSLFKL